jgi:hypothetical protein
MNSSLLKKAVPHIIAIVVFLVVAMVYNKPALQGKVLEQSDVIQYNGMAQQSKEYKIKYGHFPLWMESAFSGMPAYNIALEGTSVITIGYFYYLFNLGLPKPIFFFFTACVCFYILTQVFKLNSFLGVLGSIAYAYATFDPILVAVGHDTEIQAISYLPAVIAGILLILQGRYLLGAALTTLMFGMQISTQHLQVIYYTGIITGFILLAYFISSWKQKRPQQHIITLLVVAGSLIVGFMNYALVMLPTKEYASETMRGGKSELTQVDKNNKSKGGLDKDYAFMWSYGIKETLTLFVPGMSGGGSGGKEITGYSKFADKLEEVGIPEDNALRMANNSVYWGAQSRGTSGPVYLGAVMCFLFILGIVFVNSWHKWWILAVTVFAIVLSWGSNFPAVNYFLFDHMPLYNKFRAPTMALIIPQFTFPLLSILGLQQLICSGESKELVWIKFKKVLYGISGLLLITLAVYFFSDYKSDNDSAVKQNMSNNFLQSMAKGKQPTPEMEQQARQVVSGIFNGLEEDRKSIFGSDMIRSFLFVLISTLLVWLFIKNRIKPVILLSSLIVLSSYDLLAEGTKYLNDDTYLDTDALESVFAPTPAEQKIKADPEKNFRVLDESSGDPFQDSHASYFFNSVGGYYGAKLALYDDIIQRQLIKGNQRVFNMLNTKYIIQKGQDGHDLAMLNPGAFGACWLVSAIKFVNTSDEEMAALDSMNVRDTAIVQRSYAGDIPFMPIKDSTASIKLIENENDKISYQFQAKSNQFVVFSEIYYNKGWDAYIDGKKSLYCRVDYVLRGMPVPAGSHTIEFRFQPESFIIGNRISIWAAIITYLLVIAAFVSVLRGKRKKEGDSQRNIINHLL